tara:strand:- start:685 stop:912 length:228 start_codon:yes stop_codon:yes gene_type:complete
MRKQLADVMLTTNEGDLSPQGLHLCIAFARAKRANNQLRQRVLRGLVKDQYRQPSFNLVFDEMLNDQKLLDSYIQ